MVSSLVFVIVVSYMYEHKVVFVHVYLMTKEKGIMLGVDFFFLTNSNHSRRTLQYLLTKNLN